MDDFSKHEVLHTSNIIAEMFDTHIVGHEFTQSVEELSEAANKVSEALHDFYQLAGTHR